jgi:acyl-coenzyme A thioesterase PaaI-like protein
MSDDNRRLVEQIFKDAQLIRWLEIKLISSCGWGWCETRLRDASFLQQQHGLFYAEVLMTLADHTCGVAAASTVPKGQDVITGENKVSFLGPAYGSNLICRA